MYSLDKNYLYTHRTAFKMQNIKTTIYFTSRNIYFIFTNVFLKKGGGNNTISKE